MKNPLISLLGIVISCMIIPIIISIASYEDLDINKPRVEKEVINYNTVEKEEPTINVYNHKLGKEEKIDIEKYLYGVVASEMPVDFHIEALKSQAIAARTFTIKNRESGNKSNHKNSEVCTNYACCQAYTSEKELIKNKGKKWIKESYPKIKQAVDETRGLILTYNDSPILPLYFSTSSGKTENSEEVFATSYPYLQSVESKYDTISPKYTSNLKITNKEFIQIFEKYDTTLKTDNIKNQIKIIETSEGGSVEKIDIGNKTFTGREIREILSLNSANFDITFEDNYINFDIKGFGHGVGMSQWGATGMAEDDKYYYEILKHYYQGSEIEDIY